MSSGQRQKHLQKRVDGSQEGIFVEDHRPRKMSIVCTSYCGCGSCCGWEWGLTLTNNHYLALGDAKSAPGTKRPLARKEPLNLFEPSTFFNFKNLKVKARRPLPNGQHPGIFCRYWTQTGQKGMPYTGVTSTGLYPKQARAPLLSQTQLTRFPLRIPLRTIFPWTLLPQQGTIAADTGHFPFNTTMLVPGYGWGQVQDHGSAIKGRLHVDLFHNNHQDAIEWGKRTLSVMVVPPGKHVLDNLPVAPEILPAFKAAHFVWSLVCGVHP